MNARCTSAILPSSSGITPDLAKISRMVFSQSSSAIAKEKTALQTSSARRKHNETSQRLAENVRATCFDFDSKKRREYSAACVRAFVLKCLMVDQSTAKLAVVSPFFAARISFKSLKPGGRFAPRCLGLTTKSFYTAARAERRTLPFSRNIEDQTSNGRSVGGGDLAVVDEFRHRDGAGTRRRDACATSIAQPSRGRRTGIA